MTQIAQALADRALQASVRRAMGHCRDFQIEPDVPDFLRAKLEALDRATAGNPKLQPPS